MRIIALSDTHSQALPPEVAAAIAGADLIVHVGDFCDLSVLEALKASGKPVKAVYGNMDGMDLRKLLPRQAVFECEGRMIGLIHGEGGGGMVLEKVRERFQGEKVDMVIYGHSHEPLRTMIDGVLYLNPGSATDTLRAPCRSYGVVEIKNGKIKAEIVRIK
ncbi:MAG: metallophosphoesterase family protein [Elusimicrobia bacterium]|nr:metallophosphoesterase family protein [Elusimicrobiota bacterium]